jgi:hypothetical protein
VPGIVQKDPSGCRNAHGAATVSRPLKTSTPKIHDAIASLDRPPPRPTAKVIGIGSGDREEHPEDAVDDLVRPEVGQHLPR